MLQILSLNTASNLGDVHSTQEENCAHAAELILAQ